MSAKHMKSFQHILARSNTLRVRITHAISICIVVALLAPALSFSNVSAVHAAASGCSSFASTAPQTLCIESSSDGATSEPYISGINAGDRITEFDWLINADNTGDPAFTESSVIDCLPARAAVDQTTADANPSLNIYLHAGGANVPLPANETSSLADCPWPSVHSTQGHSDVVASGDQGDVDALTSLPDGKYLISVTSVGYKIDGVHFTVTGGAVTTVNDEDGAPFIVRMNPLPKKTTTLRVHVYNDNASTNGQWDGQTETLVTCLVADGDTPTAIQEANCPNFDDPTLVGDPSTDMSGFSVRINDVAGEVTADVYGNPLCTQYVTDAAGNVLINNDGTPNPVVFNDGGTTGSTLAGTESTCLSDHYGDIVIPNLGPNRYAVSITSPDPRSHDGVKWVQTTTLEGGHDWDSWNIEGGTGFDTELIVGGERVPPVAHGFVRLTHNDNVWNDAEATRPSPIDSNTYSPVEQAYYDASSGFDGGQAGHGVMTGVLMIGRSYIASGGATPLAGLNLANSKEDGPIEDGLVSISCLADCSAPTDQAIWTGRARSDGSFRVTGLQTGGLRPEGTFRDRDHPDLRAPANRRRVGRVLFVGPPANPGRLAPALPDSRGFSRQTVPGLRWQPIRKLGRSSSPRSAERGRRDAERRVDREEPRANQDPVAGNRPPQDRLARSFGGHRHPEHLAHPRTRARHRGQDGPRTGGLEIQVLPATHPN